MNQFTIRQMIALCGLSMGLGALFSPPMPSIAQPPENNGTNAGQLLQTPQPLATPGEAGSTQADSPGRTTRAVGTITGQGSAGFLSKFTGPNAIGNSVLFESGGKIGLGTTTPPGLLSVKGTATNIYPIYGLGVGNAILGSSSAGIGLYGQHTNTSGDQAGVQGESSSTSANATGVVGTIKSTAPGANSAAVRGINLGKTANGYGVYGSHAGMGYGVCGSAPQGIGVYGISTSSLGVYGHSQDSYGAAGSSINSVGVFGTSSTGTGVSGTSNNLYGVEGYSSSGTGVYGHTSSGTGVSGASDTGLGVVGSSTSNVGVAGSSYSVTGVVGKSQKSYGVSGSSTSGSGVYGYSPNRFGVEASAPHGTGVYGYADDGNGISGVSNSGTGVVGASKTSYGVSGTSTSGSGVYGYSANNLAVEGNAPSGTGVYGHANNGNGVSGSSNSGSGVVGNSSTHYGVHAISSRGTALFAESSQGVAGSFQGRVVVTGDLQVTGTLFKAAGSFQIDHPLHPATEYLSHSFVESPDMMNVYNGNTTTNAKGEAWVTLPNYFQALNRDFRYQLTPMGQFAQAIVGHKIQGNRFLIRTDKPGVEVSWQVTGIRNDAYAREHRIKVEETKARADRGKYLYPAGFGAGQDKQIGSALPRFAKR